MTERDPRAPAAPRPRPGPTDSPPALATGTGPMSATCAPPLPAAPPAPSDPRARALLARLFAGTFEFPPFAPRPPAADLAPAEADATGRAAACPDLFALHADPAAGARAIAAVARAVPGRVLVLTPTDAFADRLTERLLAAGEPALRALADDENPVRPLVPVSAATTAARTGPAARARREAAAALVAAERRCAAFAPVAKAVARLVEVGGELARLDAARAAHVACRARAEAEARAEVDTPFARGLAELRADHAAAAARIESDLRAAEADRADKQVAAAKVREQLGEAAKKPGFFARVFGNKPKPGAPDPTELERQLLALDAEVQALAARATELGAGLAAAGAALTAECAARLAAEVAARHAACDAALAATDADRARAGAEADALRKAIAAAVPHDDPTDATAALAAARTAAEGAAAEEEAARARLLAGARVVVGLPHCVGADPVFAALPAERPFELLVLDRAEELPEPEFGRLARLAARWLLVGEARPGAPGRNGRRPDAPFFARVAAALDRESWAAEGDRFVCRLMPLAPAARRALVREPLADRPEIELRFVADTADPVLAEIAFPAALPAAEARRFLFSELGEVRLRPVGAPVWAELEASWPAAGAGGEWVELEPGVRERVVGSGGGAFTAAVSFDAAAGWTPERAAEWVAARLPAPGSRFAALPRG